MPCHLIEAARQGVLEQKKIEDSLEYSEYFAGSDKFDVKICTCRACGQLYIYCFREFNSVKFEDFYWTFWIPVSEKDIAELKKAEMTHRLMGELLRDMPHICWGDKNTVYWCADGNPQAPTLFLPPYMFGHPEG